jgi:Rhomboid family/zinc-ribbon domain
VSSGADLFVVCKQCGSEVSPYVTECPYCGNRLRRRAPKLPRVGEEPIRAPRRQGLARLLNRSPAPGRRASRFAGVRPYATLALVAGSCAMFVATEAEPELYAKMPIFGPLNGSWWRLLTYPFAYFPRHSGIYALLAIGCIGLFGWLLEQRHGPAGVLAVFFVACVTGGLVADAVYTLPIASGANAGALALLAAWAAPDLRAMRAGDYWEGDLLGVGALAALLVVIPWASEGASWLAGVVGGIVGLLAGQAFTGLAASRQSKG